MRVVAIVAAGGQGARLGLPVPKQFVELGGRAILDRSVGALARVRVDREGDRRASGRSGRAAAAVSRLVPMDA